jgi:two-component system sensor histidine kinase UhpB
MSLRARVVALIAMVLLISMLMGTLVAGYETRKDLSAELNAGMDGARQTLASALEDLPNSDHPARDLRQLIATFDGNRHVRATLEETTGRVGWQSHTIYPAKSAPTWFRDLLGPGPRPAAIPVPSGLAGYRDIILTPTPDIDVAAAWREFVGVVAVLGSGVAAGLVLVYLVIAAAFRPLAALSAQFGRVGAGDYSGRVAEGGPSELLNLQRGFNRMASELAATTERNRLLGDQLLTIQEEERADIARDLHDDIGPHLFAVNMDAEMILQLGEIGRHDAIPDQVRSIQGAVRHMQRQVRELLGRLRPTRMTELGLNAAISDLVRFWTTRRPDISFDVRLANEARLADATKDIAYRVVQEAANNAVRHANPKLIRIVIGIDDSGHVCVGVTDDGAGDGDKTGGGLGLVGMRERVGSVGGSLAFGPLPGGRGWTTQARLPLAAPRMTGTLESTV